jgi:hypothetical protein
MKVYMDHYVGYIGLWTIKTRIETLFNNRNENMDISAAATGCCDWAS